MRAVGSRFGSSTGYFKIASGLWPGALGGTRTPNLLIRSQMLYPLSYERSPCSILHPEPSRWLLTAHARYAGMADLACTQGYSAWIQLTRSSRLTVCSRAG
jgi:hypothetical protein